MSEQSPKTKIETNNKLSLVLQSLLVIFLCGYGSIMSFPAKAENYISPAPIDLVIYFNILKYLRIIGFVIPFIIIALVLLAFKKQKESKSEDEFFGILLAAVGIANLYVSSMVALFNRMYIFLAGLGTGERGASYGSTNLTLSCIPTVSFLALGFLLATKPGKKTLWWWIGLSFIVIAPITLLILGEWLII